MHKIVTGSLPERAPECRFDIRYGNLRTASDLKALSVWRVDSYRLFYMAGSATLVLPHGSALFNASALGAAWTIAFDRSDVGQALLQTVSLLAGGDARSSFIDVPARERCHWEDRFRYLMSIGDRDAERDAMCAVLRSCVSDFLRLLRSGIRLTAPDFDTIQFVLSYIEKHFKESITLRDVAEAANFSPAYLTDLVRRRTSFPVHRWIVHYRLAAAKRLLEETTTPVSSVAEEVGFGDSSHFCKQFNRATGLTPAAWRRNRQRELKSLTLRQNSAKALPSWGDQSELLAIIDAIPQIVWAKTEDGSLLFASRRWYEYTGLTRAESAGHGWLSAVHPNEVQRCLANWAAARSLRSDHKYRARIRRAVDSSYRWHLIHTIASEGDRGGVQWLGTATDVHDRTATAVN